MGCLRGGTLQLTEVEETKQSRPVSVAHELNDATHIVSSSFNLAWSSQSTHWPMFAGAVRPDSIRLLLPRSNIEFGRARPRQEEVYLHEAVSMYITGWLERG